MLSTFFSLATLLLNSAYSGRSSVDYTTSDQEILLSPTPFFSPMAMSVRDVTLALEDLSGLMRSSCNLPESPSCLNTAHVVTDSVVGVWAVNNKVQAYSAHLRISVDIINITFHTSLSSLTRQPTWTASTLALLHEFTGLPWHSYRDAQDYALETSLLTFDRCLLEISRRNAYAVDSANHLHDTVEALAFTIRNHFEDGLISLETFVEADRYVGQVKALVWDIETELYALREYTNALEIFRLESDLLRPASVVDFVRAIIRGSEALRAQLLGQ